MLLLKLAYRNLVGAGLRTWLSVIVLSLSYVVIIWMQGFLDGWNRQGRHDMIQQEVGGGQVWHSQYDPYDPLTFEDSHAPVPAELSDRVAAGEIAPILLSQATIYPQGRMQNIVLKGIAPDQDVLTLPTAGLAVDDTAVPAVIGERMARNANLQVDDLVTVRWRDAKGALDACDARIVHIMDTDVPAIDNGIFWVPLERLRTMLQVPGEANLLVVGQGLGPMPEAAGWVLQDQEALLQDFTDMIRMKSISSSVMYLILLSLALLAIFDIQVLSIFRRHREIGTLIALGMTRGRVIRLFTLEGMLHGVLAALAGAVYGIPLLAWQRVAGFAMPKAVDSYGVAIAETMYPVYSAQLVVATVLVVMAAVTVVSFLPTRRIAHLNPTDAIRGKVS
ncbi:MAG: FtsX-like permease family protein [Victivallales bacterium]|nr:FtsX-like permease family protein [Victivallales bacterium]